MRSIKQLNEEIKEHCKKGDFGILTAKSDRERENLRYMDLISQLTATKEIQNAIIKEIDRFHKDLQEHIDKVKNTEEYKITDGSFGISERADIILISINCVPYTVGDTAPPMLVALPSFGVS